MFWRQIIHAYARNLRHAQLLRRQHTAMTDDDYAFAVNYHRLHESILLDALRDVRNLRFIVLLCIFIVRRNVRNLHVFDVHPITPI